MPADPAHHHSIEYLGVPLIYEVSRGRRRDQLAQRESQRTRSGSPDATLPSPLVGSESFDVGRAKQDTRTAPPRNVHLSAAVTSTKPRPQPADSATKTVYAAGMSERRPESSALDTARAGGGAEGSVGLVLGYARATYDEQFSRLDAYRARSGGLLAFAAALVALSSSVAPNRGPGPARTIGIAFVLAAAVLFLVASSAYRLRAAPSPRSLARTDLEAPHGSTARQLLHTTLVAVEANGRALRRLEFVFAVGLVCLLAGTVVIGLYMTFRLP